MVAVLSTIGLLMGLYVAWRLFWPLRMQAWLKIVLSLLLVAIAVQLRIVATFWGTMASPEIPKLAIATLATGSTAVLLLALAMLVLDAGLLLSRLLRWQRAASALRGAKLRPVAGVLACWSVAMASARVWLYPRPGRLRWRSMICRPRSMATACCS